MKIMTVMITSIGSVTAQGVIKGLRAQSECAVRIISTDMKANNAGRYFSDAFYQVPRPSDDTYLAVLLEICKNERVDLLIPIHDQELLPVAEHAHAFTALNCVAVVSNPDTIRICHDKYQTYHFFKRIGIETPMTFRAEEVLSGAARIEYPAFLKPAKGAAAIDTYVVRDKEELAQLARRVNEPLVQELEDGTEFSVDVLADFGGAVLGVVPRTRDETRHGASYKGTTVRDEEIIRKATSIAERLQIIGPCNIQCFKTTQGRIVFFEVNPRFSATHAHTIASGMNTPHLLLKMLKGDHLEPMRGAFEDGLTMYRYWREVFVDKQGKRVHEGYSL